ncbi:glycosyltransferase family 9 protein [Mycobacterium lehmannii]|uniref:glycosyltransferase family 9 protein n=1 Tax=Mycobacterium lehmannii TaxID=2048550 RepID=UPI000A6DD9E9|nr:glycosyltransferase family 9 protein [Mycobacterium lehmannii]
MAVNPEAIPETIVVLRALGLGDLLTGIPALRGLRRAHPDAHIVLAAPERYRDLVMLTGAVDELDPTPGLGRLRPRSDPPALAVNLHGSGPESIADLLAIRPRTLISHRHPAYPGVDGPPWRAELHEVDRWCALLEWVGITCDSQDLAIQRPDGYPNRSSTVVIHPGAASAARRWPADRFGQVAAALRNRGHDVVITGDDSEVDLARSVADAARLPRSSVLAGTLGLLELVALIHDCRLLICGDTGVGHIATATGTPSVLLFGPTPPNRWGPRGAGPHIAVWAGDKGDPHADQPHRGLLLITVGRVLAATESLLKDCA